MGFFFFFYGYINFQLRTCFYGEHMENFIFLLDWLFQMFSVTTDTWEKIEVATESLIHAS